MKIRIRSGNFKFFLPVPTALAGAAIKVMPEQAFAAMRKNVPLPYDRLVSRENFLLVYEICREILIENKGLEIVHVEAADGTFVSIIL
ncbi:Uncharacterised protein [uncultured Eubacterium sp.]|uniref:hypothetical protein n=1 Tax=Emergencia sp. TaxID=1926557 RepID=UPI000822AC66|nr:Uncharacterised protein [uncultured Eubacterium sp.]